MRCHVHSGTHLLTIASKNGTKMAIYLAIEAIYPAIEEVYPAIEEATVAALQGKSRYKIRPPGRSS